MTVYLGLVAEIDEVGGIYSFLLESGRSTVSFLVCALLMIFSIGRILYILIGVSETIG